MPRGVHIWQRGRVVRPMSSIGALTFRREEVALRRRGAPVATMKCEGNCPPDSDVDTVQCVARGLNDKGRPQWECKTVSARYAISRVSVQCEGCTKPGDKDILTGSCQLRYSLRSKGPRGARYTQRFEDDSSFPRFSLLTSFMWMLLIVSVVVCCVHGWCTCCRNKTNAAAYTSNAPVYGQPMYGGAPMYGGYGGGFGGFGTGMLTGYILGDALSHHGGYGGYGGGYGGGYDGGYDGGSSWGESTSYGDTDVV